MEGFLSETKNERRMKLKRRLSFLVLLLALALVLAGVGIFAAFSDTMKGEAEFEAGTLKLDVQAQPSGTTKFIFGNIKPGDSAGWHGVTSPWQEGLKWTVKNIGSLDGTLTVSVDEIVDMYWPDASIPGADPSSIVLQTSGSGDPRLSTKLRPQVRVNGTWKTESSGLHNLNPFTVDLPAGQSVTIEIAWAFQDVGNEYQGSKSEVDFKFHLEQK